MPIQPTNDAVPAPYDNAAEHLENLTSSHPVPPPTMNDRVKGSYQHQGTYQARMPAMDYHNRLQEFTAARHTQEWSDANSPIGSVDGTQRGYPEVMSSLESPGNPQESPRWGRTLGPQPNTSVPGMGS
jgi:hypothetical protein